MATIAVILILLALGATCLLFVPVTIYISILVDGGVSRVMGIRIFPFSHESRLRKPERPPQAKSVSHKEKRRKGRLDLRSFALSDIRVFFEVLIDLVRFIIGIARSPDRYFLNAAMAGGVSRPDITGELFGAIEAVRPFLPGSISISYIPDFESVRLNGRVDLGCMVRGVSLLKEFFLLLYRLPKVKILKLYWKYRKGGRHGE